MLRHQMAFMDVVPTHWAYRTLQELTARQIVKGIDVANFKPQGLTTRAEFTALLVRALELSKPTDQSELANVLSFDDIAVSSAWYAADVAAAWQAGLVQGVSEARFAPNSQISREQMAAMIVRAYELKAGAIETTGDELIGFKDSEKLSEWAKTAVEKSVSSGLMKGQAQNRWNPQATATRAETAQAILNLLRKMEQ